MKTIFTLFLRILIPVVIIAATIILIPVMILSGVVLSILVACNKGYTYNSAGGDFYIYPVLTSDLEIHWLNFSMRLKK